jgi:hypothetical protein
VYRRDVPGDPPAALRGGSRQWSWATKEQAKDTGLAAVLILLLMAYFWQLPTLLAPAIGVLVLTMAWPAFFRPAAVVWFGLSHLIGTVASKVILSIVFFVVATPIGLLRRLLGADSMRLRGWKRGRESVFGVRDHVYTPTELERPF